MFPAEAAAEQFIGSLLANVNGEITKLGILVKYFGLGMWLL